MLANPENEVAAPRQKLLLLITALATALWGARSCLPLIAGKTPVSVKYDLDCIWLMTGIEPTRNFAGTLRWWTGAWCCDFVPYYRPATSLFFWLEYRAFGANGLQGFTLVHLLSHLVMTTLCALFLAELVGWRRATLAMAIWGLHLPRYLGLGDTSYMFPVWKDSCDIWCCICYILALWSYLRFLRTDKRRYLGASAGAFFAALAFKEMAYTLPLMLFPLLWHERRLRERLASVVPYFALALVALIYRFWALQGPGFRNGTNGAWLHRTAVDLGGAPAMHIVNGNSAPVALALLVFAICLSRSRKRLAAWTAAAAIALWGVASVQTGISIGDLLYRLLSPLFWEDAVYSGASLLLACRFIVNKSREQRFGYAWVVIAHIPLMAMPVGEHGFYLVAIGWSLWLGESFQDAAKAWENYFRARRVKALA